MTLSKGDVMALLGARAKEAGAGQTVRQWAEMPKPVKSYARISSPAGRRKTVRVHLEIASGWYIYGKPLLFPYMTPLSVDIRGGAIQEVLEISFPPPRRRQAQGNAGPLHVYEGSIMIEARLLMKDPAAPGARDAIRVLLRYQPCSADSCLAPVNTAYRVECSANSM